MVGTVAESNLQTVAPVDTEYCPTPQVVQVVDPFHEVYVPEGHKSHEVLFALAEYLPAAHEVQFDLPSLENDPGWYMQSKLSRKLYRSKKTLEHSITGSHIS